MIPGGTLVARASSRYTCSQEDHTTTDQPKKRKIKDLELNKETVADLTEEEAEHVEGGAGTITGPGAVLGTRCCGNWLRQETGHWQA